MQQGSHLLNGPKKKKKGPTMGHCERGRQTVLTGALPKKRGTEVVKDHKKRGGEKAQVQISALQMSTKENLSGQKGGRNRGVWRVFNSGGKIWSAGKKPGDRKERNFPRLLQAKSPISRANTGESTCRSKRRGRGWVKTGEKSWGGGAEGQRRAKYASTNKLFVLEHRGGQPSRGPISGFGKGGTFLGDGRGGKLSGNESPHPGAKWAGGT